MIYNFFYDKKLKPESKSTEMGICAFQRNNTR